MLVICGISPKALFSSFVLLVSAFLKYHPGLRTVMSSCALEIRTEKILLNINNPKLQHEPAER